MANYSTKLTADTSQHDAALKRSASQVYQYKKQAEQTKKQIADLASKVGKFAGALGVGLSALELFKKAMNSTEQGTDAMARTMHTTKGTVDKFFQSLTNGNFDGFLNGLKDIISTAREAYNALDDLGTMKMWKSARQEQLKAQIAEDRVIVNSSTSSNSERKAAQERIKLNTEKIQALTDDITNQTHKAMEAVLRQIAGDAELAMGTLQTILQKWENGTLEQYMKDYKERMSTTTTQQVRLGNAHTGYYYDTQTVTKWNNGYAERYYNAMKNIQSVNEEQLKQYYDLMKEDAALRTQTANAAAKANTLTTKGNGGNGGSSSKYEQGSIADIENQIANLQARLRNEVLNGNQISQILGDIKDLETTRDVLIELQQPITKIGATIETMPTLDGSIIDADSINEQLQDVIDNLEVVGMTIDDLTDMSNLGEGIGYLADCFDALGDAVGDDAAKMVSAFSAILSSAGQTIAKVAQLMVAEGVGSAMELPFPANLAAAASVFATLMTIIGQIRSIGSFADGGIIQGNSAFGDMNIARVNSGEMILNSSQQARLFKMLNMDTPNRRGTMNGGDVTFTIRGADLVGTLNNYNKRTGRVH